MQDKKCLSYQSLYIMIYGYKCNAKSMGRQRTQLNNQEGSQGNTPHKRKLRGKEEPPKIPIEYHGKDTNWTITTENQKIPIEYHRKDTNWKITSGSQKPTQALETKFPSNEAELPLNQRRLAREKARERESKRKALKPIKNKSSKTNLESQTSKTTTRWQDKPKAKR